MGMRHLKRKRGPPLESSEIDPMVKFVVQEFERYENAHRDRFDNAQKIYNNWLGCPPTREYNWQNAVHVPITFEAEQTITPRLFAALFPNEAPLEMVAYNAPELQGITIRDLIKHYFRLSDVQGKALIALTQCSLLGTGYLEDYWLHKTKYQIGKDGKRYLAVTDARPDCEAVSFFEMFPHPAKKSMDDGLPLIRRRFCDAEYIKRLAKSPNFEMKNLKAALDSQPTTKQSSVVVDKDGKPLDLKKREEYELLEYWGPWDSSYEKDGKVVTQEAVPHCIMVVNRTVKIRGMFNPYNHQNPPFIKIKLYPDIESKWFGVGIGKIGQPSQERLNKIVNQRLDNVDLVLNKQGFYNGNDPLINVKKLKVAIPGQWHKVSDTISSIRWMDIPDVTASSYKEEELAKADFRESTGATIPLMPTDQGQHRTASGISLLQGAAGMRFRPILRRMEIDLIQELAHHYLTYLQQFMTAPEWIQRTSSNGMHEPVMVRPEDIQARIMFLPTGISEMLNKEMQVGQLLRFKEVTMNDPTINRAVINKRIAELMGFKDISEIIVEQKPAMAGPGQLAPGMQERIRQRLAEGATPEQIKLELLGNPPDDSMMPPGMGGEPPPGIEGMPMMMPPMQQQSAGPMPMPEEMMP